MEHTIDDFVDKLLQEKGVYGLSTDVFNQLKQDLVGRAEKLIDVEILANMPKDKLDEFEKKIDSGDDAEIQRFCSDNVPNIEGVVAGALIKLKDIYLTNTLS